MKNQLTTNFSLDEFTKSATAIRYDICNEAPLEVISNLQNLCQQVLQPLRDHLGVPVIITSGYRCRALNRLVGGVPNSQHITGEAADFVVNEDETLRYENETLRYENVNLNPNPNPNLNLNPNPNVNGGEGQMLRAFEWIRLNCDFDQLIWEERKGRVWIHVSCCRKTGKNRHQVIRSQGKR